MTFSEKIDEWIKEAEVRPGSALMILKLIAGRMRDLSERNEELAAENIALEDGSRVKALQERIAHLEFQLELLKQRFGSEDAGLTGSQPADTIFSLLVYNSLGRILRLQINEKELPVKPNLGLLKVDSGQSIDPPRLLAVPTGEELLLLFSSGRVGLCRVVEIRELVSGSDLDLGKAVVPDPPHAGELLVSVMPLSRLPVSDFFLQTSRRGAVKKTNSTIFEKVLSTRYLGQGTIQKSDQAFLVALGEKKARLFLVTYEGHVLCLDAESLLFSAEERIRIELTDRIVAAFIPGLRDIVVCLTHNGKIIQREAASFEIAKSAASRGQMLIPPSRLEQGTRFVGALACGEKDWLVTLDAQGNIITHQVKNATGAGSTQTGSDIVSLGLIQVSNLKGDRA